MRKMKDSGVEWIGEIPENWRTCKVSFLYDITLGKMIQPFQICNSDTLEYYICAANLGQNRLRTDFFKKMWMNPQEKDVLQLKKGDLLVVEGGDVASSDIIPFDLDRVYFQNSILRVRGKGNNDNRILRYLLILAKSCGHIDLICNKATIAHFTKEKLLSLQIVAIPISEQQAIADYLDRKCAEIDALTSDIEAEIETLEQYKQSVITEAVTKGLDPNTEMKDSGVEEIGVISSNFSVVKLKYLFGTGNDSLKIGPFGSTIKGKTLEDGPYKIYNQAHLISNNFSLSRNFISDTTFEELKAYEVNPGDILFSMMGTIGKCCIMPANLPKGIMDSHLLKARLNDTVLPNFFVYVYDKDNSDIIINQLSKLSNGTIMNGLNSSIVKNLYFPLPSLNEQEKIITYLDRKCAEIDALISDKRTQLTTLADYKKSLIYEYVTGKKEVPAS